MVEDLRVAGPERGVEVDGGGDAEGIGIRQTPRCLGRGSRGRVEDAVVRIDERMGRLEHSMSRFGLTVVVAMTVGFLGNITAVLFAAG